jgi:aldose 1-epimerase
MTWDETCPWVQLHTTDLPGYPLHRAVLSLEPMTCPPDACNSGTGVITLHPGDRRDATWRIDAVDDSA